MEKFLADENVPPPIIQYLKGKGLDVKAVREFVPAGSPDSDVIDLARRRPWGQPFITKLFLFKPNG